MYGLSDRLKPLSAAEEQVLLAVWDCPAPATRRDISEKLTATGWARLRCSTFCTVRRKRAGSRAARRGARTPICPRSPAGPTALRPCASGWTPCSAAACPKRSALLPARAALPKASWNRPSGCWRSSIRRQKNTTCTIPMGNGKTKKLPLRELFRCIRSKDVLKSNAKRYCT